MEQEETSEDFRRFEKIIQQRRIELRHALEDSNLEKAQDIYILFKIIQQRWLISCLGMTEEKAHAFIVGFEEAGLLSKWFERPIGLPPSIMSLFGKE